KPCILTKNLIIMPAISAMPTSSLHNFLIQKNLDQIHESLFPVLFLPFKLLCFHLLFFNLHGNFLLLPFFHSVINPACHQIEKQTVRVFVIDHTSLIFHPVTLFFHIRQDFLCGHRIHALHVFHITTVSFFLTVFL